MFRGLAVANPGAATRGYSAGRSVRIKSAVSVTSERWVVQRLLGAGARQAIFELTGGGAIDVSGFAVVGSEEAKKLIAPGALFQVSADPTQNKRGFVSVLPLPPPSVLPTSPHSIPTEHHGAQIPFLALCHATRNASRLETSYRAFFLFLPPLAC